MVQLERSFSVLLACGNHDEKMKNISDKSISGVTNVSKILFNEPEPELNPTRNQFKAPKAELGYEEFRFVLGLGKSSLSGLMIQLSHYKTCRDGLFRH